MTVWRVNFKKNKDMKNTKYYEGLIIGACIICILKILFWCETETQLIETVLWAIVSVLVVLVVGIINLNKIK